MKKIIILMFTVFPGLLFSQSPWSWQNPLPIGKLIIGDLQFISADTGWAVGAGFINKTIDGGLTWRAQLNWESYPEFINCIFNSVCFVDGNLGMVSGVQNNIYHEGPEKSVILKTTDGGNTWSISKVDNQYGITSISLGSSDHAIATGSTYYYYEKVMYVTDDGGRNWVAIETNFMDGIGRVFLTDSKNGTLLSGESIYRTFDGGFTWHKQYESSNLLTNLYFLDSLNGTVVGKEGIIVKTTDAGLNWSVQNSGTTVNLYDVSFIDHMNGLISGGWKNKDSSGSLILRTSDGGITWNKIAPGAPGPAHTVSYADKDIAFIAAENEQQIYLGFSSIIQKTSDGGILWRNWPADYSSVTYDELSDVVFIGHWGLAVGKKGIIIQTSDGGSTWVKNQSGTINNLSSVFFLDKYKGIAVGDSGKILQTADGGYTWIERTIGPNNWFFKNVFFTSISRGYIAGYTAGQGIILSTTDGGFTWNLQYSLASGFFYDVTFTDKNHGVAVGRKMVGFQEDVPIVVVTTNGGYTWNNTFSGEMYDDVQGSLRKIYFSDPNNGIALGGYIDYDSPPNWHWPYILKTEDGGLTWRVIVDRYKGGGGGNVINDVAFLNANTGIAVGKGFGGRASETYITTDGGENWAVKFSVLGTYFNGIAASKGYAILVGQQGAVVKYNASIHPVDVDSVIYNFPNKFALNQCYPNPFNSSTTISFSIHIPFRVIITIYDVIGREISRILDEEKPAGNHRISFDASGLGSGIYYYQIKAGEFTETKKMLLLK